MASARRIRQKKRGNGIYRIILVILHKEGPLPLEEIEDRVTTVSLRFASSDADDERRQRRRRRVAPVSVETACKTLAEQNLVTQTSDDKYALTEAGKAQAETSAQMMEHGADVLENQLLSPKAAARNTVVAYLGLAIMKLGAGLFGGSVGLIADGADTSVDTASAGVVWLGIRFKKELLGTIAIIALMFATAATLAWQSAHALIKNINGTFVPMNSPLLVIFVELIALGMAFLFSYYQRFVGKRSRNLALISQSIDSKNSVYSAASVIVGALFSIFGIYWVDAIVGACIAARITWDSIGLTREAYNALRGKEPNFGQYKMPFEDKIHQNREEAFRNWILYLTNKEQKCNKTTLTRGLQKAFHPTYMPALFSEFTLGKNYDFDTNFDKLIKPLIEDGYIVEADGIYCLTESGKTQIKTVLTNIRYRQFEEYED
jgi:cation diffusion facilitator family transporter